MRWRNSGKGQVLNEQGDYFREISTHFEIGGVGVVVEGEEGAEDERIRFGAGLPGIGRGLFGGQQLVARERTACGVDSEKNERTKEQSRRARVATINGFKASFHGQFEFDAIAVFPFSLHRGKCSGKGGSIGPSAVH